MSHFHPLVHNALDVCFKGSGHPKGLNGVMRSSAWKKHLRHYESLPERLAGTELGHLLNAGPHRVGLEFCHSKTRNFFEVVSAVKNCPEKWQANPHFLATLDYLGEEIQNTAIQCLPAQFLAPAEQAADWASLNLPLTPGELANAWHEGDIDTRLNIGRLLAEVFYEAPNKKPHDKGRDILHQKPEYVLPGLFGPWDKESAYQPNCLGKVEMVAAFARYAAIDALIVIPAQPCFQLKRRCRGELAELCLEGFSRAGVPLMRRRRQSLERIASAGRHVQNEPSWLHACIALRLESELWMLVDPNGEVVSFMPVDWAMGTAYKDLEMMRAALPGLSFLEQLDGDYNYERDFRKYRRHAQYILHHLGVFAQKGFPSDATKSEIIERLVNSKLLDVAVTVLLDDGMFGQGNLTFKPRTRRRYKAVCLLLEHIFCKCSKKDSQELEPKINWRKLMDQHPSITEGLLFSKITDGECRRGLETLCYALGTRVLQQFSATYQRNEYEAELIHPQCQIGGVGYFLATSALAHVAYCLGQRTSLQVESLLCHHAFDLHRLHVVAGTGVTHWKNDQRRQQALEAVSLLEALPFVLPSTERILPYLKQMRLFTQVEKVR